MAPLDPVTVISASLNGLRFFSIHLAVRSCCLAMLINEKSNSASIPIDSAIQITAPHSPWMNSEKIVPPKARRPLAKRADEQASRKDVLLFRQCTIYCERRHEVCDAVTRRTCKLSRWPTKGRSRALVHPRAPPPDAFIPVAR